MPFISVTRLRIRSWRFMLPFFWYNQRATRQIKQSPGFRTGLLFVDADRTFWTITAWDNQQAMLAYRNADAHRDAMPKLQRWCDEASVVHWDEADDAALPSPPEAYARMMADGRRSKLRHPNASHTAWTVAPPRWPSHSMLSLRPKQQTR